MTQILSARMADMVELKPCPFCGRPAHRITPMGFWTPQGYSPAGVRYACSALYADPPQLCPGDSTSYGNYAEERAKADWNTRSTSPAEAVAAMIGAAREAAGMDGAQIKPTWSQRFRAAVAVIFKALSE